MSLKIAGSLESFIDIPHHFSKIYFLQGCNFDCPFCHNYKLIPIIGGKKITVEEIITELNENWLITAVGFSGGEPFLQFSVLKNALKLLTEKYTSVDTNGSFPHRLNAIIDNKLVSRIAVDLKGGESFYRVISKQKNIFSRVLESINILSQSNTEYEIRTVISPSITKIEDLRILMDKLDRLNIDFDNWILQRFSNENVRLEAREYELCGEEYENEINLLFSEKGIKMRMR